jgi:hypothetical protein
LASHSITEEIEPENPEIEAGTPPTSWKYVLAEWLADIFLFSATAAVVIWQNSRITVLYDLCGVLEPAYRMSLGDRPYLDFPFPYAPLTFLIQTGIIKLWGAVYWHHIVYVAIAGGLASVLTWRLLMGLFRDSLKWPRTTAFLLTLPIVILGIYCIFPHPFYDPDATLFILLSLNFILWLERRGFSMTLTLLGGISLVVPLFVKQNIGGAYLGSWLLTLFALILISLWKKLPINGYLLIIFGALVGLAIAAFIIESTVGLANYKYWIWDFATARRTPSAQDMLSVYQDPLLILWIAAFAGGSLLFWNYGRKREAEREFLDEKPRARSFTVALLPLSIILMAMPFVWPVIYLFIDEDASERSERLANLWPVVLIASFAIWIFSLRKISGLLQVLPLILIFTINAVFLSQQLWGSTYGIWPLFILLVGLIIFSLNELTDRKTSRALVIFAAIFSVCLITAGAFYVYSNERLEYIDFEDGELEHSTLPQLEGLAIRGSYLPDFEELVRYTNENIPHDDGVLELPGEDLFYYTTGRHPVSPVLLFDVTNNPYSAEQIAEIVRNRNINWLIVKNDLQLDTEEASNEKGETTKVDKTIDDKDHIFEVLKPDFKHIEGLNNYEIYRRKLPGESDEDEDDDSGDDSDDDSGN